MIILIKLANNRTIDNPMRFRAGKFEVQLPNDNRWKGFDSIEEAVEWPEEEERAVVVTITVR